MHEIRHQDGSAEGGRELCKVTEFQTMCAAKCTFLVTCTMLGNGWRAGSAAAI